jgi:hypothetical protein
MRPFFITLWKLYRIVVGTAVLVMLLLHFVILAPSRHGSQAAPPASAQTLGRDSGTPTSARPDADPHARSEPITPER